MKVKLSRVFDLQMGKTPARNNEAYWGGTNKWISIADIGKASKYISDTKERITDKGVSESGIKKVPQGTVIMSFKLSIGKTAITSEDMFTNEAIMAFIDKGVYPIDTNYFYHFCHGRDWTTGTNKAVMGLTLNKATLSNVEIDIPEIEQQREIASRLDFLDALIASRREQLAKLDELVKSRFIELFGDPVDNPKNYLVKSLQELIDMGYITYHLDGNHGGDYPRSEEFVDSGVPYIGANSIVNGKIDFSMAKFLTAERAGKLRKGIAQNDDVLFAHNATVGPTVVLKTTEPKVILSTSLTAYRCDKSRLLPNYLKAYMQSDGFVRQYSGEMKQTTRNQVPITAQKKYLFLVPPFVEQEQFAAFVEQTDKSKLAIQESLEKLELLKKALMQKYFG